MQYTINQLYDHLHERVNTIYDTFKGFFGEDNVDMQGLLPKEDFIQLIIEEMERCIIILDYKDTTYTKSYEIKDEDLRDIEKAFDDKRVTIYVWWNRVTITNENDRSINIQDLYAKIEVTLEGRIPYEYYGFLLNRATYTKEQFISGFLHSHVCNIPKDDFTKFQQPCLGTGPIKGTIDTLRNEYDEVTWMLFCEELALYVTVESLTGRPYNYLEHIGGGRRRAVEYSDFNFHNASTDRFFTHFFKEDLLHFIKYYLQKGHLSITFKNGKYSCGMPYYEYIIDVSNAFIDFYNEHLASTERKLTNAFSCGLFKKVLIINGKFYMDENYNSHYNLDQYRNKPVLRFKGKDIVTTITEENENQVTLTTVLDNNLAMYILKNILRTINFRYKNEYKYSTAGSTEETSPTSQRVSYL